MNKMFCYELGLVIICAKIFCISLYFLLPMCYAHPHYNFFPLFILTKYLSLHLSALGACGVHDLFMESAYTLA